MTNPNNAIGTPSGYGGRTSVLAYNSLAQGYARGVLSGFDATIDSANMVVNLGGSAVVKDIAIAQNSYGEKAIVLNTTSSAVSVSLPNPSATQQWASIVAYVASNAPVSSAVLDNTSACGIIAVVGTGSAFPTEAQIRTAIASDGGDSLTSPYVVVSRVKYSTGSTSITGTNEWAKFASTFGVNADTTLAVSTSSYTNIPLYRAAGYGDNADIENGEFVVPAGLNRLELNASASMWVNSTSAAVNPLVRLYRTRGSSTASITEANLQVSDSSTAQSRTTVSLCAVLDVEAGDRIGLQGRVHSGSATTVIKRNSLVIMRAV